MGTKILINSSIFPVIMSIQEKDINGEYTKVYHLPRSVNLLYLENIKDKNGINLLIKYANKEKFSDKEFETMFKFFLNNIKKPDIDSESKTIDFLTNFGVEMINNNGITELQLIEDYVSYIKKETWECIVLDILKDLYTNIIRQYDFGDIQIYLGPWKTDFNEENQSLLNSFRSAFLFTLVSFLYGDNRHLYNSFYEFFNSEFSKRIAFVYGIWKTKKAGEKVKYIPIYDSFFNMKGLHVDELIEIILAVLENNELSMNDKDMIKNAIINGAETFHKNVDAQTLQLEKTLIKPVVNYIMEIQSAADDLKAAQTLHGEQLYNQSVNRSYYSMMHSLKALFRKRKNAF
ncbi:HEPN domain-containing protein [Aeribacillus sp. FSL M8-0235]|uniref:HEPN domain-containing protein n=1 Tax=Aeribacillus sp. FSL M8-0235 TaxID=2954576 RepID=UPI0030F85E52